MRKVCAKCGCHRDVSEFNKDPTLKDGLDRRCKPCHRADARSRRVRMVMPDGSTHDCLWQNRKPHIETCVSYERYKADDTSVITATKPEPQSLEHPELTRIRAERAAAYSKTDAADNRAKDGFVYLIRIPGQVAVKIGHARDPMQRIKSVSPSSLRTLRLYIWCTPTTATLMSRRYTSS